MFDHERREEQHAEHAAQCEPWTAEALALRRIDHQPPPPRRARRAGW
ncbi:hypothetical protein [Pseudonocardia xinjiangensis]|uniref:Uncharacterized protein n=1 Tax=Pseudonocardia xinjiangensis TaxID=75289 RepID=A0ABX1RD32_9PSEU|nr:hypothetical protein [Pseudonocardia xinjiangensis]NMH77138.1 hypothetical protein [Pseudonocardia xinjiangensis]